MALSLIVNRADPRLLLQSILPEEDAIGVQEVRIGQVVTEWQ
jgi:hypothetical protein